ncbi:MAG: PAS domain-containing protein, partial [Planctomycetaceae bacterium]|nr:PAS domain-containing protein [Planctomycetaceae bacterium]
MTSGDWMIDFFKRLFDTDGFPPRWDCGSVWKAEPGVGWLHIISDIGIFVAYMTIPIGLAFFITRRRDIPFPRLFWLFVTFIFACGTTHLLEAGLFYWPAYRFSGLMKALTAGVSLATVATLLPLLPRALALRSPGQLEREIAARTAELRAANERLQETAVQRQKAEQSSRNAARRFLAMTESLPDIFFTADAFLRTTSLNPAFTQLTGMAVEDGVDNGWLQAVHENDRERVRLALADAVASGVRFEHEFRLITREGG